ncbi:hypothetical protein CRG98_040850 [Punica granatum]|uniref:Uncharacterized protein n=1 Tax=Punica granatum TaxID=22663 RepID=A0A2I0I469_PUNGR|nr:hypothetical protein CRG98_040850 [Punica granatum]
MPTPADKPPTVPTLLMARRVTDIKLDPSRWLHLFSCLIPLEKFPAPTFLSATSTPFIPISFSLSFNLFYRSGAPRSSPCNCAVSHSPIPPEKSPWAPPSPQLL